MTTFSLCMIVRNEEAVLSRCLDSLKDLMDEIIIVDTGSTDRTKEIAAKYTDLVYDYTWIDDFAAARNFAFEKAHCDYIYSADADEVLDAVNQKRLAMLKKAMLPEIEIVQMHYLTQEKDRTTQNFADEYRPKLFKRLRTFTWIHPVHETVRLNPVVFDSDIEILHLPQSKHSKRDFTIFTKFYEKEGTLPPELFHMYARELFICGTPEDFSDARVIAQNIFESNAEKEDWDILQEALCILSHCYYLQNDSATFFNFAFKALHDFPCSEICYDIGMHFEEIGDIKEACYWYETALNEATAAIDARTGDDWPRARLSKLKKNL